ncbi:MAG: tRNA lysidine(34) synthetase TilS [Gammaproteobacteria bacterium]|nr:tRNA lysidine(34) synthetase TilS [Gammaproteobacteria bacterium]MDH3370251.1 tRNA lysidine(34) synthetase TilS [Gammaproteobacteria bacterium]MDH3405468.1 tRNA lysidine(34) synthetase TilS [Gammaproteobacteria bacterium]MDH3563637.1 tRNA lysidine(34) synthetase TilS [Gammaproteobacteria bacterium]MDH5486042.1 tRNA lysidine(34) synthetase TilS [Gammaproteobacteria bacterium]
MKNIDKPFSPSALVDVLHRLGLSSSTPLKVAFSGGLDSCVLLHALGSLREPLGLSLSAVHVNHGLHPDSADWARRARQFCEQLNISCVVECIEITRVREHGLEAAARHARYACLARHVAPGEVLLTAHQADDQAETLLLQLLRGTGMQGLAAMPAITQFHAGRHARPLLDFTRAQVSAYATQEKLQWIVDTSNDDLRLSRNYLRHQVVPRLEAHWPGAVRRIAHSAGMAAEAVVLLDDLAESDWILARGTEDWSLSISALRRLPPPRQRNLVRYWLRRQSFLAPTAVHLNQVLAQVMQEPRSRSAVIRWAGAEVCRYRDALVVMRPRTGVDSTWRNHWNLTDPLEIPGVGMLRAEASQGNGLSRERVGRAPVIVGLRQGGEICRLPGRAHHHKLKKLLQEAGVPPWERTRLPLVYVNGDLAAIGERWVCEPYAARVNESGWKLQLESVS